MSNTSFIFEWFATAKPGIYDLNDPALVDFKDQYIQAGKEWIDAGMKPTLDFNSTFTKIQLYKPLLLCPPGSKRRSNSKES